MYVRYLTLSLVYIYNFSYTYFLAHFNTCEIWMLCVISVKDALYHQFKKTLLITTH